MKVESYIPSLHKGALLRINSSEAESSNPIVNPRKLEHGFRRISAGIPSTLA